MYDTRTGVRTDIGRLASGESIARAINDDGLVVGQMDLPVSRAFLCEPGAATLDDLGTLGGVNSAAEDLNERGTIVGWSEIPNDDPGAFFGFSCPATRAFTYDIATGSMTNLGTIPGMTHSSAHGINEQGVIVGRADELPDICGICPVLTYAVAFELGATGRYQIGGAYMGANAVNDAALVVGTGIDTSSFSNIPFAFTAGAHRVPG